MDYRPQSPRRSEDSRPVFTTVAYLRRSSKKNSTVNYNTSVYQYISMYMYVYMCAHIYTFFAYIYIYIYITCMYRVCDYINTQKTCITTHICMYINMYICAHPSIHLSICLSLSLSLSLCSRKNFSNNYLGYKKMGRASGSSGGRKSSPMASH